MRQVSSECISFFRAQELKVIHVTAFCDPRHIGGTVQRRYIDSDSFDTWETLPGIASSQSFRRRKAMHTSTFRSLSRPSRQPERRKIPREIPSFIAALMALWILALAVDSQAAAGPATSSLAVRIEPAAFLLARPIATSVLPENGAPQTLVQVELAVRMNPGATASLRLYRASDVFGSTPIEAAVLGNPPAGLAAGSGIAEEQPAQSLFTINKCGRYTVILSIPSEPPAAPGYRFRLELKSSDNAFQTAIPF